MQFLCSMAFGTISSLFRGKLVSVNLEVKVNGSTFLVLLSLESKSRITDWSLNNQREALFLLMKTKSAPSLLHNLQKKLELDNISMHAFLDIKQAPERKGKILVPTL